MNKMNEFRELGISENVLNALNKKGFEKPTPIQKKVIPMILKDNMDVVGQAQTGTGKTAAFGIPIIENCDDTINETQAIILTPTRELALQVSKELNSLKGSKKLNIVSIYGGQPIGNQIRELKKGAHIVVGTPGRVIDHLERGTLKLDKIKYFVLDEADEMLDMGFIDDIEKILKNTNKNRRTLLFSATLPHRIMNLVKKYMGKYNVVSVKREQLTNDLVDQKYYILRENEKYDVLCNTIDSSREFYGLVFCKTRADVNDLTNKLSEDGYLSEGLHGDISQNQREKTLSKFRNKKINILVATDVAARGIDINNLSHVINYSLPQNPESYVHRIGRTGRAGKRGTAITFVKPDEFRKLRNIEKIAKTKLKKENPPTSKDVLETKKDRIIKDILNIVERGDIENIYYEIATELFKNCNDEKLIPAIIKYSVGNKLSKDVKKSKNMRDRKNYKNDNRGTFRDKTLYIGIGKNRGMTPKKLVDYVEKISGVPNRYMDDVKIYDKHSNITVSKKDGDVIISKLKMRGIPVDYSKK